MTLKALVVAAAFAASPLPIMTIAPVMTNAGPIADANLAWAPLDWPRLSHANVSWFAAVDDGFRNRNLKPGGRAATAKSPGFDPKPGLYKTTPYSCIVIVPGKNPDDSMAVLPAECSSAMPVIKPELHFIPLRQK
jgi:hypothetical protein